jgi:primosomal protein DnaI
VGKEFKMNNYLHSNYFQFVPKKFQHCALSNFDFTSQENPDDLKKKLIDFIEGTGNKKGLYLHGSYGVGKTHLLVSLYRVILAREQDIGLVHFISCERIIKDIFARIDRKESTNDYIDYMSNFTYLFLDDLTAMSLKEFPLEVIRQIINYRYENDLSTCFTANAWSKGLYDMGLHPHVISRISDMCEICLIEGTDRRVNLDG